MTQTHHRQAWHSAVTHTALWSAGRDRVEKTTACAGQAAISGLDYSLQGRDLACQLGRWCRF
jgi:hypothetical protein